MGIPTSVPKVPGAKGNFPTRKPVAKNSKITDIGLHFKLMEKAIFLVILFFIGATLFWRGRRKKKNCCEV